MSGAGVAVYRTRSYYRTDCVTCSEIARTRDTDDRANERWARSHARQNPGHSVHVEVTYNRVFEARGEGS